MWLNQSRTPGKAGGLKNREPLKAVNPTSPLKGAPSETDPFARYVYLLPLAA
jgi:hypothetical protein